MAHTDLDPATVIRAMEVVEELVSYQKRKVLELAQRIHPGLTEEDVRNIHDYPDVYADPIFQFEDGQLAGFVAAQIALKARLLGGTLTGGGGA
ncbi:MAG TPA: hypothetical protein VEB43_21585 [Anaeromyxobacter sp.]|nr:hypothetical protein [Anaeromyxobacter sp.]